ncbi:MULTISPECIES: endopeptidase La [Thalassospira]|jgi:ATP-dependent Lon protease|uniref:Lon protease n=3 Tax=Thalassospira xiamenensis TaxID=220697 RepID=A0ABR5Y3D1_9PROT|nr:MULTISPECIES: endopeptidase La [Thalassospira]MBR9781052.1 endopeptidase La [Rhodospirillales bacterium]AJD52247.1 ATP-dependent Lon protease [Thalassospira xiamenensis M-5 = DSM 17429]KZD04998.1 DNA-binding protein [Thalassospira xiamenensis]KZD11690.1 DNA-binding protein [Thalassospira xiamenensis]MAB31636.1 endopeptidase La [Thalassospira sp.]|tara:strand:+ start:1227 stop:3638 length:2412 start_codon:yes stop_codon:yes gene_type:complete
MVELARGEIYPVLPLRDIVVFPHMIVPLFVGREKSVRALEDVMREDKQILLVTQKDAGLDDPSVKDLYEIGTVATVLQLLKLPDGTVKVLVEGGKRAEISGFVDNPEFFQAYAAVREEADEDDSELEALARSVVTQFEQYIKLNKKIPPEVLVSVNQIEEPAKLADTVASHLSLKISEKQELLETTLVGDRLERIFGFMESEIGVLQVEKKIRNRVKRQMEKTQREYYLNEQLKAIQKELGEGEDGKDEASEIEEKLNKAKMPKEAKEKAQAELKKLRNMSPMSAEATVVRNYLDWMVSIPWNKRSRVSLDLKKAKKVLDKEHYGLEKVKEHILEYLAVQARVKKVKGPILCLVGPPGVGKTSLGKSIANATGRTFVRMSLGGVRDESEIRGHRRTYIGSMPGKIIQGMKKAKYSNPLFLLDEIEKMGSDFRGDPASALLEVLDPEQNSTFNDHYLEVDYDLSDVMFVTTANSLRMQQPLLDRMEIIRISGYTEDEKVEIAKRHLIPKQVKESGLRKGEWSISDDALRDLIRYYTREAGVRSLERELAKLARKATKRIMLENLKTVRVTPRTLGKYAGIRKFRYGETEGEDQVGVVTGLAYTEFGGDLLQIESVTVPGKGNMKTTGKLGEVMTESIQAATSFVRSRATQFGIKPTLFQKRDIHVHVPEGATPKDGPSAGVGMVTSVVSVLTGNPVRRDVAMTGEITLRGRVLAIGGLKEKLLAALRGGVKTVLIPQENEKDLEDIPDNVKRGMEIIPVSHVDEVLSHALVNPLVPIEWEEEVDDVAVKTKDGEESEVGGVTTH